MRQADRQSEGFVTLANGRRRGVISEFAAFLLHTKKWWLAPVIIVLLLVGGLLVLGSTAAAPLIYTLF